MQPGRVIGGVHPVVKSLQRFDSTGHNVGRMRFAVRSRVAVTVLTNPMSEACFVVSRGVLENNLLMHRRLDAHAAQITIDATGEDSLATLIDQVAHSSELFAAESVKRLGGEVLDQPSA